MSVGESRPRIDAEARTTGEARYPADLRPADALFAQVVFTNEPHARLVSLDVSAASAAPGVVRVFVAADVPVNEYGLTMFDQPVMIGTPTTGRSAVPADVSRWEADHLALVVAETEEQARRAALLIETEWESLPIVGDLQAALEATAADRLVHPEDGLGSNAYHHLKIRKGDMARGWDAARLEVEAVYELPYQEHAFLQPEAGVARIDDDGRIDLVVAGQWTHEDREQIAHALDIDESRIRVRYPAIGGAFGGREDMSLQIVLALAADRLHAAGESRPVFSVWSREESIVGHHKRHRARIRARWGADDDGIITAVEADALLDAGAYNYTSTKVLGNLHLTLAGPYRVPNAQIDSRAVYTNNVPGGAFRGFGAPQGAFVAETQLSKLALRLGLDPVEIRRRNHVRDGDESITQAPMPPGVSIGAVIERCALESRWTESPVDRDPVRSFASLPASPATTRRGRGFACAFKNIGFSYGFPERCEARIVLHGGEGDDDPSGVDLYHAGADVGQGAHTVFVQMAAEAIGIDPDRVRAHFSDTASAGDAGSASASRLTFMAGNSIRGAAEEAEKAWRDGDRPATGAFRFIPRATEALDPETGAGDGNITFGYVSQAVDLSVDLETGVIVVHEVVNVSDVGRAINPTLVTEQVRGAIVQAHGYALTEDLQIVDGRIRNPRLSTYLMPGIGEIPESIRSVLLEIPDPQGPWGARGMAEMPLIPYAPAVAAALADATGVWIDRLPLTPHRVRHALAAASH